MCESLLYRRKTSPLPRLASYMCIWDLNGYPEGQKEKVTYFHAMLNMQISREASMHVT